ncbi:MAG: 16S rRNA (guanine(966)-N(2))-methyltransferase RsmD [Desulfobacterales bacterium]|nr:16S rRNA (guanine(966)-N(2))-methyltransferase RsmD [Desulfobacterales bacterium]MDD3081379.1 16S rRNA (guanine(966)-N(2))-methyltransferase RsmD [Desulfobacterales bacterium]MDD3950026.1 16S rRNA (guanine(966)-N(2))-methyltransferase RsmD [Desulfobacterales bacterium]MDD4463703.1 16S rRNA (guanine(966)-N(2))-methyltransferase RsmD [Desulfobacterales bacterium]MDY0377486.1 16S rRNA (guanine(966)-N(2))-methyltransferase RsmD [Desulfobacterales bacterium]
MGLRIISGALRGRRLASVLGMSTRPTSDRLREAVFNILGPRVMDASVLDLFAGTGALGIEALSRGADSGVFIDNAVEALVVIRKNIAQCALKERSRVIRWNILKSLDCIQCHQPPFDLVFMDPPYGADMIVPTLNHLQRSASVGADVRIVVEHDASDCVPQVVSGFKIIDQRRYGKSFVSFLACLQCMTAPTGKR